MNVRQSLQFAVAGVLANKMRSALTMSGIVIGVAAVIILVAAGTGAGAATTASISALGSNTLTISPESGQGPGRGGVRVGGGGVLMGGGARIAGPPGAAGGAPEADGGTDVREAELTLDDAEALVDPELAPSVASVAPVVTAQSVTATYAGASHEVATLTGTTPSYLTNTDDTVQAGASLTDTDYVARNRVALVGVTVATALVGGDGLALLGQPVQLNGVTFQVAGVLTAKGSSGPQDQDDRIIAPMTAVQDTLTGYGALSSISVKAVSAEAVPAATAEVTAILNARHGTGTGSEDFSVSSPTSLLEAVSAVTETFTLLLGAVAGISLLVGGIGVMNIMLVTVTERTREIGIRKAVGAQRSDIVGQFLLEATILSMAGGVLGVGVGVGVGSLSFGGFQLVVAPFSVLLAFLVSVAIGLFFGFYPANKAAKLRPIHALRYE
ncbi:ABC transporter permease [Pseudonocardia kunmingensis]|uniref:Putative ABC transport system permease protein n=1 Tax=Pseudonocardia kunmingensis TaxID=630975 RepID=A0A543CYF8_9PSEU|nr:ABC transporter permease [Pseudonocardia kunmingensis]TQM02133.1 putative ABC transport system permease protein [Pseudonocardia kunmingensis]